MTRLIPKFLFVYSNSLRILELGAGRSGSTFLFELLATIPNSFVLPEPYYHYEIHDDAPFSETSYPHPSLKRLYDCSFLAHRPTLDRVFWDYACENIPSISNNPNILDACFNERLNEAWLHDACMKSDVHIIKVIRMAWLASKTSIVDIVPAGTKVVHVVRAPWSIVHSQHELGWYRQYHFHKMVPSTSTNIEFHTDRVCKEILLHSQIMSLVPKEDALTIRYEDLMARFEENINLIFDFIEVPLTGFIRSSMEKMRTKTFATEKLNEENMIDINLLEAVARSLPSCQSVLAKYDYLEYQ